MEQVSLQNLTKIFTPTLIKKSEKLIVRDIDEESTNHFVAYVDEGDNSFDVRIILNQKKEVLETNCDCESNAPYCIHKIALLQALVSKKAPKLVKVVRKRKQTETEIILDGIAHDELKIWIIDIFKKNKDLELLFLNEFKEANSIFTTADIKVLISVTVKSVIKNKKNIDATQLKKTLDLLESSLNSVMKSIVLNVAKAETLHLFEVVVAELINFEQNIYVNSVKIQRFIEKLNGQYLNALYNVKDNSIWQSICKGIFATFLSKTNNSLHLYHLQFLYDFYEKIPNEGDKKLFYLDQWISYFNYSNEKKYNQFPDINKFVIKICQEMNVFDKHCALFKPLKYENDYNEILFKALLDIKKYDIVEIYAKAQISTNSEKKFNLTYYSILKNLYKLQQNDDGLMTIALNSILLDYDFETYLFVKNKFPKEFTKFKKDIYKNTYNAFNYSNAKQELLYMKIFNEEKDVQAILKYLPDVRNLSTFNQIFEDLTKINKTFLFYIICRVEYFYGNDGKAEVDKTISLIKTFYTKDDISMAYKQMKSIPNGRIYKIFKSTDN